MLGDILDQAVLWPSVGWHTRSGSDQVLGDILDQAVLWPSVGWHTRSRSPMTKWTKVDQSLSTTLISNTDHAATERTQKHFLQCPLLSHYSCLIIEKTSKKQKSWSCITKLLCIQDRYRPFSKTMKCIYHELPMHIYPESQTYCNKYINLETYIYVSFTHSHIIYIYFSVRYINRSGGWGGGAQKFNTQWYKFLPRPVLHSGAGGGGGGGGRGGCREREREGQYTRIKI